MRKKLCFVLIFISMMVQAQKPVPMNCLSDDYLKKIIHENPELQQRIDLMNQEMSESLPTAQRSVPSAITIPVVVYVVHDPGTPATNISDGQVQSQLSALNDYFSPYNINFCLATRAGTGTVVPGAGVQTTPGILHIANAALSDNSMTGNLQQLVALASPLVIPERYLRIFVVKSINGPTSSVQGYASFPFANYNFDGIVMKYNVFGNQSDPSCGCSLLPGYNTGKILVHEVGHYFGLYHTFEDGCAGMTSGNCATAGDRVCDTPPVAAPNYGCNAGTNSCSETPNLPDNINNFMDYGYSCINMFTTGQKNRMMTMLNTYKSELFSAENILYTGTCGFSSIVTAGFTPTPYMPCAGVPVNFHPHGGTLNYSWNFGDGTPIYNTNSNTDFTHTFASAAGSPYTVTLTVDDGTTTTTSTALIYVTACSPINNSGTNWYFSTNNSLSFSTGVPVFNNAIPLANKSDGVSAIQNDASGNLLFYTNGIKVYNHLHNQINSGLVGHPMSGTNKVLIVPNPANSSQYYIFKTFDYATMEDGEALSGLRYSIVSVAGGTATMISENIPVTANAFGFPVSSGYSGATSDGAVLGGSSVTAVQNCNGYWILTTLKKGSLYHAVVFSLTSSGLSYQSELSIPTPGSYWQYALTAAPNGNKIFLSQSSSSAGNFMLDFNKAQGILGSSTPVLTGSVYGSKFSPDSKLLYLTDDNRRLCQYNVNSANIASTRIVVASSSKYLRHIQEGPDGKLYILTTPGKELAVVHKPNIISNASNSNLCHYYPHGPVNPSTVAQTMNNYNLQNNINAIGATAYFPANSANAISVYTTGCNQYKFFPNICGNSFSWKVVNNTTSTTTGGSALANPTFNFTSNGSYTVYLLNSAGTVTLGSTNLIITNMPTPVITGSSTACGTDMTYSQSSNSVVLAAGQTAQWAITGGAGSFAGPSNLSSVQVNWTTLPGTLTLTVTNANGCTTTATRVINALSIATPVIQGCTNACIEINPKTVNTVVLSSGQTAQWSIISGSGTIVGSSNTSTFTVNWTSLPATIQLKVTNSLGCSKTVTKTVNSLCCEYLDSVGLVSLVPPNTDYKCARSSECTNLNIKYTWVFKNREARETTTIVTSENCAPSPYFSYYTSVTMDVLDANGNVVCSDYLTDQGPFLRPGNGNSDQITVSPNPSDGMFNLRINDFSGTADIIISDSSGRIVYRSSEHIETEKLIDLSHFQTGMYLLYVTGENFKYTQKLIKK